MRGITKCMAASSLLLMLPALSLSEDSAYVRGLLEQNESQLLIYSCRFEVTVDGVLTCSGVYHRDATRERCLLTIHSGPGSTIDWLTVGEKQYQFHPNEAPPQLIIKPRREELRMGDPAVWRLLWSMESENKHRSLAELLSRYPARNIVRDREGNVEFTLANHHTTTCVLSARANFAPSRMQVNYRQGGVSVSEVKEFAEPCPGVYFPLKVVGSQAFPGRKETAFEIRFSEISVGRLPADAAFEQSIPEGTRVADEINQVVDVIGPGGVRRRTSLELVSPDSLGMGKLLRQTEDEGMQIPWFWLVVGFGGLLLLAAWLRRQQLKSTSAGD